VAYAFMKKSGIPVVIVRLFNTIGPHQTGKYGMVVPNFVHQAAHNLPVTVFSDGNQTRSFCDVRDTVVYLDLLASNPSANGEIVNVGNNHEISIHNLAQLVIQQAESQSEIMFISYQNAYGIEFEDISHRCPDLKKLHKLTNYPARWSLGKTLDSLIETER
jgi:UDP-glucose 4-epimerase